MSTKSTISYDSQYHLYQEIFDVSNVHLDIYNVNFEATNKSVKLEIPIKVWRAMIEDWSKRGWPVEDDNKEIEISTEWIESLQRLVTLKQTKEKDESKSESEET
jgi:hypothetical protein